MKNLFSFGIYPFEKFYLNNSSSLTKDDFSHILSDIHLIAPHIKFNVPSRYGSTTSAVYSPISKQIYTHLEKRLTAICQKEDAINNIILLCMDMCSPYKYPLAYLWDNHQPSTTYSPLRIFEDDCFIKDTQHMMKLSWLYNLSTKNSPTTLSEILDNLNIFKNEADKDKFTNRFDKTKSEVVASYRALYSSWEELYKNQQKPILDSQEPTPTPEELALAFPQLCIYDSLSTQGEMLFKKVSTKRKPNLKIDSKYDLSLVFGLLRNRIKNDPLFHIYGNDRVKGFKKSFDIMLYLDKFFPIQFPHTNDEIYYSSIFGNYFTERFTNINLINQFFELSFIKRDPSSLLEENSSSTLKENEPFLFSPLFLLALHPLINFRLILLEFILSLPKDRCHTYFEPLLKTVLHQSFFYFPLLQTLFHLCMLITKEQLSFSPNKHLIFPKDNRNYHSYLETFNLSNRLLFTRDANNTIQPYIPFPDMNKEIILMQNEQKSSFIQKDLHTLANHSIFKLLQQTLCNIKNMDFMDLSFDYHHATRTTSSFPDSVIYKLKLTEISSLMEFNQTYKSQPFY